MVFSLLWLIILLCVQIKGQAKEPQIVVTSSIEDLQITKGEQRHIKLEEHYNGFNIFYNLSQGIQPDQYFVKLTNKYQVVDQQTETNLQVEDLYDSSFQLNVFGDWGQQAVFLLKNNSLLFYDLDRKAKSEKCIQFREKRDLQLEAGMKCRQVHWLNNTKLLLECLQVQNNTLFSYLQVYSIITYNWQYIGNPLDLGNADQFNIHYNSITNNTNKGINNTN